jgi:dihydroorotase
MVFKDFRIVDGTMDTFGSVMVEDGLIAQVTRGAEHTPDAGMVIEGGAFGSSAVLMPAFIDLHAHFREPAFPETETALATETIESASLAAVAGGYGTVVCMANTKPAIDTMAKARAVRERSAALGLVDLYPALSLTKNMEGRELSGIQDLPVVDTAGAPRLPLLLSEDGRDVTSDGLFLAAMREARRLGVPVSCHCDCGGPEAEAAKAAGRSRAEWSRIEENNAVRRAIALGTEAGCHVHIAHVSTKEAAALIRQAKKSPPAGSGFTLTCEATPHHIAATEADARRMGEETYGRVNPPLRSEADREAIIAAIGDGVIDAIATDHAPHSETDKALGAPGFTALETAFAASYTCLVRGKRLDLRRLSHLMSAAPAAILGLTDRGKIAPGLRADFVIAAIGAAWNVDPAQFKSRGKCGPFTGRELWGKILVTVNRGRMVFEEKSHDV